MSNSEKIRELEEQLKVVESEEEKEQILEDIEGLKNYEKGVCFWCEEVYDLGDLYHTNLEGCLCEHCIEAIRSRGEKIKVGDSYYCCEDEIEEMENN
jgi:hypothetical protein